MQVWDSLGRLLYQSAPQDHVVTAVAWSPSSDLFAVGSFNTVSLCGRSGSAFSKVRSTLHRPLGQHSFGDTVGRLVLVASGQAASEQE